MGILLVYLLQSHDTGGLGLPDCLVATMAGTWYGQLVISKAAKLDNFLLFPSTRNSQNFTESGTFVLDHLVFSDPTASNREKKSHPDLSDQLEKTSKDSEELD